MKDIQRYLIIGAIAVLSFMLLTEWVQFREQADARPPAEPSQVAAQGSTVPVVSEDATLSDDELPVTTEFKAPAAEQSVNTELVTVGTYQSYRCYLNSVVDP